MATTPTVAAGRNVKAEMTRRGLSQQAVAARLGISQTAVSARLRGITPFDVNEIVTIAGLLGMTVDELLVDVPAAAEAAS
jgi:transcriptional regulator with XRE-family HTH domain